MFNKFALNMVHGRAFIPMMEADGGAGAGSGAGEGGASGAGEKPGGEGGAGEGDKGEKGEKGAAGEPEKVTFTEAQQQKVNDLIAQQVAKERAAADKKATDAATEAEKRAKMTADQLAEQQRLDREKTVNERETAANNRIINLELKAAASAAGVPAKKLERFLRVVSREEIEVGENGDVDQTKVSAAIKEVLDDMPEFKGSGQSTGPGGDFNGGAGDAKYTPDQIAQMTPQEISKNWEEVNKSISVHNK